MIYGDRSVNVGSDGQAVLSNCIDLVGSDDENDGARTESMIGHTESGSNK